MYYRIYQAKVLGALPSKRKTKKGEPEPDLIRESKDALYAAWETQKLFQDAICYYICALAGLSAEEHPTRQIVTKRFNQISERFERYGIIPKTGTAELFWRAIYGDDLLDNEGKNILLGVFNQLSDEAHKQPKDKDGEPDHLQKLNTVSPPAPPRYKRNHPLRR